jgi:hypothetical protein
MQYTPSAPYAECSKHQVQHTYSTSYTKDYPSSLHCHEFEVNSAYSSSICRTSLQMDRHQPDLPKSFEDKVTLSHAHGFELSNQ